MNLFAMFFAAVMLGLAVVAVAIVWHFSGWIGGLAFATLLIVTYRLLTHESGRARPLDRSRLNAFQQPLADD